MDRFGEKSVLHECTDLRRKRDHLHFILDVEDLQDMIGGISVPRHVVADRQNPLESLHSWEFKYGLTKCVLVIIYTDVNAILYIHLLHVDKHLA